MRLIIYVARVRTKHCVLLLFLMRFAACNAANYRYEQGELEYVTYHGG